MIQVRMRTINEYLKEIQEYDERILIKYNFVKTLCGKGKVKFI